MSLDRHYPKTFYRGRESRVVADAHQESMLGPGWTTEQEEAGNTMGVSLGGKRGHQEYPKAITGRDGKTVVVGNAAEEAQHADPNLASDAAQAIGPTDQDKFAPIEGVNKDIPIEHQPGHPSGPTVDETDRVTDPSKTVYGKPVFVSGEKIPDPKGGKDGDESGDTGKPSRDTGKPVSKDQVSRQGRDKGKHA